MATAAPPFPRIPLIAAGVVVALSLAAAIVGRLDRPARAAPEAAVAVATLRFADRADGSLAVLRAGDGATVDVIAPRTDAFVRVVMYGLGVIRRQQGVGPQPPFRLTRWADGRLTLSDPSTGRHIDLEAFGPTNEAAFATLLRDGATP